MLIRHDSFDGSLAASLKADYQVVSSRRPEDKLELSRPTFVDQPGTL